MESKMKQYMPVGLIIGAFILGGIGFWLLGKSPKNPPGISNQTVSPTISSETSGSTGQGQIAGTTNTQTGNTFSITITSPANNSTVKVPYVRVVGTTSPGAEVFINGMEGIANAKGNFSFNIALDEGENTVFLSANDVNGSSAEQEITVNTDVLPKESAVIKDGTLSAKKGNILTVTKDDKTYTVTVDKKTQLRRRFWGKAALSEMQEKDTLNIIGKWTNAEKTKITARLVKDTSIQKRYGVFFGTIQSTTATGLVMETEKRGTQTVTYSSTTRFLNRKSQIIKKDQIKSGDKVRIKGLWNNQANTITEVVQVKDFSLPVIPPTLTPKPTSTHKPSVTK